MSINHKNENATGHDTQNLRPETEMENRNEQMLRASKLSYRRLFEASKDDHARHEDYPCECVFK